MLCRATERRFYNGVMVGPDTGNNTVNYLGKKKDKPADFVEITEEDITAAEKSQAALINRSQEMNNDRVKAQIKPAIPESGGGASAAEESITSAQAAEHMRGGTQVDELDAAVDAEIEASDESDADANKTGAPVTGASQANESQDQSGVQKDEEGNVLPADKPIEK